MLGTLLGESLSPRLAVGPSRADTLKSRSSAVAPNGAYVFYGIFGYWVSLTQFVTLTPYDNATASTGRSIQALCMTHQGVFAMVFSQVPLRGGVLHYIDTRNGTPPLLCASTSYATKGRARRTCDSTLRCAPTGPTRLRLVRNTLVARFSVSLRCLHGDPNFPVVFQRATSWGTPPNLQIPPTTPEVTPLFSPRFLRGGESVFSP